MLSFWESNLQVYYDFTIVGGGILGLHTAYELALKYPKAKIAIYERDQLAAGASSKNDGFACFGSLTEIMSDRKLWGDDKTYEIIHKRWLGIQRIQSLLGDKIDFENYGGYELILNSNLPNEYLREVNAFLFSIFKKDIFSLDTHKIKLYGFGDSVKDLIFNSLESQIHSGKLILALHELLREKQVHIYTHAEVTKYTAGSHVNVLINDKWSLHTGQLIFCTNAFLPEHNLKIKPGRGQVFITQPIPDIKFKGCFHFCEGYYYFRNVGDRILFGGGRNLDVEGETNREFDLNSKIQQDLNAKFSTIICPGQEPKIEMRWAGIMAFSENKLPTIESLGENVLYAMNCNGMGVSLSPMTAQEIAKLI